ncbi:hypothetical protein [Bifidobacterium sp.]|uniref:alpha-L-rhamnosidase-related protein n=1 Tax=Bifidobacterium sp. TaxID=41200 RepID=UPI0039EC780C
MRRNEKTTRTIAISVAMALCGALLPMSAVTASAADTEAGDSGYSVADLADSSAQQQRWLSLPKSRLTLNPGQDVSPSATDTLNTAYFAGGSQRNANNVVSDGLTTDEPVSLPEVNGGDLNPAFSDQFTAASAAEWTGKDATLSGGDDGGTVTLNQSAQDTWGNVSHSVSVDLAKDSVLTVDVSALVGDGTQWSISLGNDGANVYDVQTNTTKTGIMSYDLSGVTVDFNQIQIWVNGTRGTSAVKLSGLAIHTAPVLNDDFTAASQSQWSSDGATLAAGDSGGTLTLDDNAHDPWGNIARAVSLDPKDNPMLTLSVPSLHGADTQWSLTLGKNGSNVDTIQANTTQTGTFSFDLSGVSVDFNQIQLWVSGTRGSSAVTFGYLRVTDNASSVWMNSATDYTNTWNPQSLDYKGTYGSHGSYTTSDVFLDADSLARTVSPNLNSGSPTLYGSIGGTVQWNATSRVLTMQTNDYTNAIAFPEGSTIYFFGGALGIDPMDTPSGASRWAVVLPNDAPSSVGFGYAVGGDASAASSAEDRAQNGAVYKTAADAIQRQTDFWNGVIAKVPSVKSYALTAVDAQGVTESQIKAMYYNAFVSLDMNVLPATPENGSTHAQMPVGKADTYASPDFTYNTLSAAWDTPLALQNLAYIDPTTANDIFTGMMSAVVNSPGQSDDGQFGTASEALPARIAQTAWILYSVTGDKTTLQTVYPAVKRFLNWSSQHPQWNNYSHYPNQTYPDGTHATWQDERDVEFVASLAVDYQFAGDIAKALGKADDVSAFAKSQDTLRQQYAAWFFPGGNAAEFYWGHLGLEAGWPVSKGNTPDAILTGLLVPGLTEDQKAALLKLFDSVYDPDAQFAGIATETAGLKAPDEQYMLEGLLTVGRAADAEGFLQAVIRDQTKAHVFSENYNASENGPVANGERPSTFGISQMIDNVWKLNGYDMDQGTAAFVKLPHSIGGVSGLTYLGKSLNVAITETGVSISGDAAKQPGVCSDYVSQGDIKLIATTCATVTLSQKSVRQGEKLTVDASRLAGNASATLELHSDPVTLATGTTSADGTVSSSVTIPKNATVGKHTIVVTTGDVSGSAEISVTAASGNGGSGSGSDSSSGQGGSNGSDSNAGGATQGNASAADTRRSGNGSGNAQQSDHAGQSNLAQTGADIAWFVVAMVACLSLGVTLNGLARRRSHI